MRTEDRVIPDLLCGRDEHLVRDTEAPELRGRQGAAATHRAASVAYAVTGAALTGWPGGTCGYRPISARSHRRVASPQRSTTLPTPCESPDRHRDSKHDQEASDKRALPTQPTLRSASTMRVAMQRSAHAERGNRRARIYTADTAATPRVIGREDVDRPSALPPWH